MIVVIDGIEYSKFSDLKLGVNAHQLKIWRERDKIRYIKLGNQLYLYSVEDAKYLKNNLRKRSKNKKGD